MAMPSSSRPSRTPKTCSGRNDRSGTHHALFQMAAALWIVGATIMIQHGPFGNAIFSSGSMLQTVTMVALTCKVFRHPGLKDFLDR